MEKTNLVPTTKARVKLFEMVRRTEDGEAFSITRNGKVVAVLAPIGDAVSAKSGEV